VQSARGSPRCVTFRDRTEGEARCPQHRHEALMRVPRLRFGGKRRSSAGVPVLDAR